MSRITLDIKIGENKSHQVQQKSIIRCAAKLKKQQIDQFHQRIPAYLDVSKVPFIMLQFPQGVSKQDVHILKTWLGEKQNQKQLDIVTKQKDNKTFYLLNNTDPNDQFIIFVRKLQKVFSELNTLDNDCYVEASFFNVEENRSNSKSQNLNWTPLNILMDHSSIQGVLDIDNKFYDMFCSLVGKISPKFANSPITAMLPLLDGLSLQLEFDSINQVQGLGQSDWFGQLDEQLLKKTQNISQNVAIYISFFKLGFLQIKISPNLLPYLNAFNLH